MEQALGTLRPAAPGFDLRIIQALAAARREKRRAQWWRGAAAALAAGLAVVRWVRRPVAPVERMAQVPVQQPTRNIAPSMHAPRAWEPETDPLPDGDTYLVVRQRVLRRGLSGLTPTHELFARAGGHSGPTAAAEPEHPLESLANEAASDRRPPGSEGPILRFFDFIEKERTDKGTRS